MSLLKGLILEANHEVQVMNRIITKGEVSEDVRTHKTGKLLVGWFQVASSGLRQAYAIEQIAVEARIYVTEDPIAQTGDIVIYEEKEYSIVAVKPAGGTKEIWYIDVEGI
jgi:hypothetical protein